MADHAQVPTAPQSGKDMGTPQAAGKAGEAAAAAEFDKGAKGANTNVKNVPN